MSSRTYSTEYGVDDKSRTETVHSAIKTTLLALLIQSVFNCRRSDTLPACLSRCLSVCCRVLPCRQASATLHSCPDATIDCKITSCCWREPVARQPCILIWLFCTAGRCYYSRRSAVDSQISMWPNHDCLRLLFLLSFHVNSQ